MSPYIEGTGAAIRHNVRDPARNSRFTRQLSPFAVVTPNGFTNRSWEIIADVDIWKTGRRWLKSENDPFEWLDLVAH